MGYFDKLADLGFMVMCRRSRLGTTTMFAVREDDLELLDDGSTGGHKHLSLEYMEKLPEWRVVDFSGDDAESGAKMLYEKLTCSGEYANWDKRISGDRKDPEDTSLLIGFEHRPDSERYRPVE